MNSIGLKQNQVCQRFQILTNIRFIVKKNFSKDSGDDSPPNEEKTNIRPGILHDKQQSVKEESYFHKEAMEKLKLLKQKLKGKEKEQPDRDDKN